MIKDNSWQAIHKISSTGLALLILLATPFHIVLLASDSSTYRQFVFIQIGLLVLLSYSVWLCKKPTTAKLITVSGLAFVATYINAIYLNYGNGLVVWVVPTIGLLVYSASSILASKQQIKTA